MPGKLGEWQTINSELQHCLWLSHQAWLRIKMLQCWRKAAWPPQHLFYIFFSEKLLKTTAKEKTTYCIYLKPPCSDNPLWEKKSFLSNMILDINFCVRIFFPIHPWLSALVSPEVKPGCEACERFVISSYGIPPVLSPHLKKQMNCTTKPMASED